ncbi:DNA adenine methylase [uncultured Acinetobacter sp.]|uniref:DNA adenine methylase n=1 Tax=uncultured Acinetobacter sp. TaxID=165433 RepID=UPI002622815E|nr:DNA adenine methylase [uncultured Acinetobacter sp.]
MSLRVPGLLKWPGGKERELLILKEYFPHSINNYYEPFVGGGSVFLNTEANKYYINDLYDELYYFYKLSISENKIFKQYLKNIDDLWLDTSLLFDNNINLFMEYIEQRHDGADVNVFSDRVSSIFYEDTFTKKYGYFSEVPVDLQAIMKKNIASKVKRILKHEEKRGFLNAEDLEKNFKSALKAAIYTYIRDVYNFFRLNKVENKALYIACFYFIRNYCYSSMFRFNSSGGFNVPYGGISYNENYLGKKIDYIYSPKNIDKYRRCEVYNLDFEIFMSKGTYTKDDFIFLDPPYDTDFSDYAENVFDQSDQERLAKVLLRTEAKWLLVTKHTDFIQSLYDKPNINIDRFDKTYQVSFKNRNNRNVQHLIIRNYLNEGGAVEESQNLELELL